MQPKVSIITPVFNSENYISDTINSILSQTFKNWELILVDDNSTDNSVSIIKSFVNTYNNIFIHQIKENKGPAFCRNKATKLAKGDFIAFLDSDDIWNPKKLEIQIDLMTNKNVDVCFTSYDLIDDKGSPLDITVKALPTLSYSKLIKSNYIGNLTGMYNAKSLGKIYVKDLRKRQDWLLWLNALKISQNDAIGIQQSLAYYRIRDYSISSKKANLLKHNYLVYRKGLDFSVFKSLFYLVRFLIEQFFVKNKQIISSRK